MFDKVNEKSNIMARSQILKHEESMELTKEETKGQDEMKKHWEDGKSEVKKEGTDQ